jgi:cephalosporin hydroxylase
MVQLITAFKQAIGIVNTLLLLLMSLGCGYTHDHMLPDFHAHANLVFVGSYCIVFDTVIEDLPAETSPNRPWAVGKNPKTAVHQRLKNHPESEIDKDCDNKLLISVASVGYLRRIT